MNQFEMLLSDTCSRYGHQFWRCCVCSLPPSSPALPASHLSFKIIIFLNIPPHLPPSFCLEQWVIGKYCDAFLTERHHQMKRRINTRLRWIPMKLKLPERSWMARCPRLLFPQRRRLLPIPTKLRYLMRWREEVCSCGASFSTSVYWSYASVVSFPPHHPCPDCKKILGWRLSWWSSLKADHKI